MLTDFSTPRAPRISHPSTPITPPYDTPLGTKSKKRTAREADLEDEAGVAQSTPSPLSPSVLPSRSVRRHISQPSDSLTIPVTPSRPHRRSLRILDSAGVSDGAAPSLTTTTTGPVTPPNYLAVPRRGSDVHTNSSPASVLLDSAFDVPGSVSTIASLRTPASCASSVASRVPPSLAASPIVDILSKRRRSHVVSRDVSPSLDRRLGALSTRYASFVSGGRPVSSTPYPLQSPFTLVSRHHRSASAASKSDDTPAFAEKLDAAAAALDVPGGCDPAKWGELVAEFRALSWNELLLRIYGLHEKYHATMADRDRVLGDTRGMAKRVDEAETREASLKKECSDVQERVDEQEREIQTLKKDLSIAQTKAKDSKEQMDNLQTLHDNALLDSQSLQSQLSQARVVVAQLMERQAIFDQAAVELFAARTKLAEQQTWLAEAERMMQHGELRWNELWTQFEGAQAQILALQNQVQSHDMARSQPLASATSQPPVLAPAPTLTTRATTTAPAPIVAPLAPITAPRAPAATVLVAQPVASAQTPVAPVASAPAPIRTVSLSTPSVSPSPPSSKAGDQDITDTWSKDSSTALRDAREEALDARTDGLKRQQAWLDVQRENSEIHNELLRERDGHRATRAELASSQSRELVIKRSLKLLHDDLESASQALRTAEQSAKEEHARSTTLARNVEKLTRDAYDTDRHLTALHDEHQRAIAGWQKKLAENENIRQWLTRMRDEEMTINKALRNKVHDLEHCAWAKDAKIDSLEGDLGTARTIYADLEDKFADLGDDLAKVRAQIVGFEQQVKDKDTVISQSITDAQQAIVVLAQVGLELAKERKEKKTAETLCDVLEVQCASRETQLKKIGTTLKGRLVRISELETELSYEKDLRETTRIRLKAEVAEKQARIEELLEVLEDAKKTALDLDNAMKEMQVTMSRAAATAAPSRPNSAARLERKRLAHSPASSFATSSESSPSSLLSSAAHTTTSVTDDEDQNDEDDDEGSVTLPADSDAEQSPDSSSEQEEEIELQLKRIQQEWETLEQERLKHEQEVADDRQQLEETERALEHRASLLASDEKKFQAKMDNYMKVAGELKRRDDNVFYHQERIIQWLHDADRMAKRCDATHEEYCEDWKRLATAVEIIMDKEEELERAVCPSCDQLYKEPDVPGGEIAQYLEELLIELKGDDREARIEERLELIEREEYEAKRHRAWSCRPTPPRWKHLRGLPVYETDADGLDGLSLELGPDPGSGSVHEVPKSTEEDIAAILEDDVPPKGRLSLADELRQVAGSPDEDDDRLDHCDQSLVVDSRSDAVKTPESPFYDENDDDPRKGHESLYFLSPDMLSINRRMQEDDESF